MDNILHIFPELVKIDEESMNEVYEESKMYQRNALRVLYDLQQSYQLCWTMQMTKRCAQMLLKQESITISHLYETGILDENEYSHIGELIENKIFTLEYGTVQLPAGRKKAIEKTFDLLSLFQTLSENEKVHWKSVMKPKHRWFQPGAVLLEKNRTVSTAYLIIRGIIESKDDTLSTYYMSGNIVASDALFSEDQLYQSQDTYSASSGLVEAYAIDSNLLDTLLDDKKMSGKIYIEIALQMLINNHQRQYKQNHSQLKLLFEEKAILHRNQLDFTINLKANERLYLLAGTLISSSNQKDNICLNSPRFILLDSPSTYRLNSSSIVLTWTEEDEISYLNVTNHRRNFSLENSKFQLNEILYPRYSGETIEFTQRRQSIPTMAPVKNLCHLQFVPSESELNQESTISSEI